MSVKTSITNTHSNSDTHLAAHSAAALSYSQDSITCYIALQTAGGSKLNNTKSWLHSDLAANIISSDHGACSSFTSRHVTSGPAIDTLLIFLPVGIFYDRLLQLYPLMYKRCYHLLSAGCVKDIVELA